MTKTTTIKRLESATVRARIQPDLKNEVDIILKNLGITTTQAINMYYKTIANTQGIPLELKVPNKETIETFEKTDRSEEIVSYDSYEDFEAAVKSWADA